jgi:hypothetical protein
MNRPKAWAMPVVLFVSVLMLSGLACGKQARVTPTVWVATVAPGQAQGQPLAQQPSVQQPAAQQPPAEQPAAEQPPAQQPPAQQPPPEQPPAAGLPVIDYFTSENSSNAGCFYLHWDLHDATAAYLNGQGVTAPGSTEVCPETTTDYTLRAENAAGSVEQTVTVAAAAVAPPPEVIVPAQQLAARVEGSNVVITWRDASNEASYVLMLGEIQSLNLPADTDSYIWENPPCSQLVTIVLISRNADGAELTRLQTAVGTPLCPAQPQTVTLQSLPAEDGYVRGVTGGESIKLNGNVEVGDGTENRAKQGFFSFDISGIPQGATIQSATLDLSNNQVKGDPFTTLGAFGVYYVQYGDLDAGDYVAGWPPGRATTLNGPPTVLNPSHSLQQLVNDGSPRFQIRLQFQYISDNDSQADGLVFPEGGPALTITYVP